MSSVSSSENVTPDNDAEWSNRFFESNLFVKDLLHGAKITARVE